MRERMRKGLAWCLAAVLLLGLLPLSPRATAAEERDLSQAEIDLDEWFYRYDKSPKEPVPTVRLDGAVVPSTDYTVSYANNTNAGQAAVTVTGTGAYFGSKTVHFTIDPRLVLPQEVTVRKCYKSFDGTTDAQPEITASSLDGPLTVTCSKASYDTPYAGTGKTVTLSGMRPSNANYTMQESSMTWDRGEIAPGIPNVKQNIQLIQGERIDLDTLVRGAGAGDVTYQFSGDSKDCVLSGSQLTAGETLGSVSLIAHIAQGKDVNGDGILDYTGGTETFSLTVVARKTQPSESGESENGQQSLTLKGGSQVTYGKRLQFTLSGGAGSGAVRYWVEPRGSPASAAWSPFADVTADAYYAAPVAWAAWNGIVNGVSATKFAPKQWITREQMASILYRYARYKQWDVSQRGDLYQFSDRSKCHSYALEALSWANATGLIQGKGKDILDPRGLASRAQVAAILQRFHQTYAKPAQTPESGETAT